MKIDTLALGLYETNCYIISSNQSPGLCLIIDPGLEAQELIDLLQSRNLTPQQVVITHGHGDHIAGIELVRHHFPQIEVIISQQDAPMLSSATLNLSAMLDAPLVAGEPHHTVQDGDLIQFGGIALKVLATPGHTPGGICLYAEKENALFAGDTLFAGSIGRTDFPNGSHRQLLDSIRKKLMILPDVTTVYPGHGPQTTIGTEKRTNPFL